MYYGLSLLAFTQSVNRENFFQDVVFKFSEDAEASRPLLDTPNHPDTPASPPLLAHANVLAYYSPVFSEILREAEKLERDEQHRIVVDVKDVSRRDYEAFLRGMYSRFTDLESRRSASTTMFRLARKFQLPVDLVENLFSATNVWRCLEFAVEDPVKESFLLQKCEKMLRHNRRCFFDAAALSGVGGAAIGHALRRPSLPLRRNEIKEFVCLWKTAGKNGAGRGGARNEEVVMEAVMDLVTSDAQLGLPVLTVTEAGSSGASLAPFTIAFDEGKSLQATLDDVQFVSQVPKELICLRMKRTGEDVDVNSNQTLTSLGFLEDDHLELRVRKMVRLFAGGCENRVDVKDMKIVDELREMARAILAAGGERNVGKGEVVLLKDGVPLIDGANLCVSGVVANAKITANLLPSSSSPSFLPSSSSSTTSPTPHSNLAAHPSTLLSSSSSYDSRRSPAHALPGAVDDVCWCGAAEAPAWWRAEFAAPRTLRRVRWTTHPEEACEGDNPKAFRIEGGNPRSTRDARGKSGAKSNVKSSSNRRHGANDDDDGIKWTTLLRCDEDENVEDAPPGEERLFDLHDFVGVAFKFCRIYVERTKKDGNFPVLHRVVIEAAD